MLKIIINLYKSQPHMEEEQAGIQKTRDFICACGKNYLSYAALFTHIKQKHDGKAPGPIVRPRSERKRGRPRKNPLADQDLKNSQSDGPKNGISFVNEINNNNINIFQKKVKQAGQLLGCGQFQAFQAYIPEHGSSQKSKNGKDLCKKPSLKKSASNIEKSYRKSIKQESSSDRELPPNLKYSRSVPSDIKAQRSQQIQYFYNYVFKHIQEIYKDYEPTEEEEGCGQIIEIFDWISQQITVDYENQSEGQLSLERGLQIFLDDLQQYVESFELKQISFFLSLFYDYISRQVGKPSNLMFTGLKIQQFPKYIGSFLSQYLPAKINELSVGCLKIMKGQAPINTLMCLCNWVSILQMQQNEIKMSRQYKQVSAKSTIKKYTGVKKESRVGKIAKVQEDIKFEEINISGNIKNNQNIDRSQKIEDLSHSENENMDDHQHQVKEESIDEQSQMKEIEFSDQSQECESLESEQNEDVQEQNNSFKQKLIPQIK